MTTAQTTQVQELVETYRGGGISRREFFQKLAFLTGSILLARDIMLAEGFASEWEAYNWLDQAPQPGQQPQTPPPTPAESIAAGEKRKPESVSAEWVQYEVQSDGKQFEIGAYSARPKTGTTFPAIIVIHENRGLTEFVLDMAQRWAAEGFVAIAVDFLSRVGGTQKFDSMQAAGQGIGQLDRAGVVADLHGAVKYLKSRKDVNPKKIGVTGFCWGGGNTFNFAAESNEIAFAAPFYGGVTPLEKIEKVSCPIFATFAESDQRINQGIPAAETKFKELGKDFTYKIYPGTQHAFMNFTSPQRYNAEAAKEAWANVLAFAKKVVG